MTILESPSSPGKVRKTPKTRDVPRAIGFDLVGSAMTASDSCSSSGYYNVCTPSRLSPSPVSESFPHIHWLGHDHNQQHQRYYDPGPLSASSSASFSPSSSPNTSAVYHLSRPELSLLQSAEENPLEYTLASHDDVFCLVRALLKVLDQVTMSNGPTSEASTTHPISNNDHHEATTQISVSLFSLETPVLDEEHAIHVLEVDPRGVITHYVISKLYDVMSMVLENQRDAALSSSASITNTETNNSRRSSSSTSKLDVASLFYDPQTNELLDDWRPLLRICHRGDSNKYKNVVSGNNISGPGTTSSNSSHSPGRNRGSSGRFGGNGIDEYSQRGAALILAYILQAGCHLHTKQIETQQRQRRRIKNQQQRHDEGELLLPPLSFEDIGEEKKSSLSFDNSFNDGSDTFLPYSPRGSPKGSTEGHEETCQLSSSQQQIHETLQSLISWLTSRLQSSHNVALGVVTPTLMVLATIQQARIAFDQAGGIGYISRHLRHFSQRNHRNSRRQINNNRTPWTKTPDDTTQLEYDMIRMPNSFSMLAVNAANAVASFKDKQSQYDRTPNGFRRSSSLMSSGSLGDTGSIHETITNTLNDLTSSINDLGNGIVSEYLPSSLAAPPTSPNKREVELTDVAPLTGMVDESSIHNPTSGSRNNNHSSPYQSPRRRKSAKPKLSTTPSPSSGISTVQLPTQNQYHQQFPTTPSTSNGFEQSQNRSLTPSHLSYLLSVSSSLNSVQQLYELVFTLWCMTLDCDAGSSRGESDNRSSPPNHRYHFERDGAIPALVQLLNTAPREKVLRLALGCLKNLATSGTEIDRQSATGRVGDGCNVTEPGGIVREMIACDILKSLEFLQLRQWNDDDLRYDLKSLQVILQSYYDHHLTHWKVYRTQLESGRLTWSSMVHTESFFKRNITNFEGPNSDFEPLRLLIGILARRGRPPPASSSLLTSTSKESASPMTNHSFYHLGDQLSDSDYHDEDDDEEVYETIAICLYDLGEFARHYPSGRVVANRFGAKGLAMKYINHPHAEIQQESLLCVSKLLVHNWRAISGIQHQDKT